MRTGASSFNDHSCHYRHKYMKRRLHIALAMATKLKQLIIFYFPFKKSIPYRNNLLDHIGNMYASLLVVVSSLLMLYPRLQGIIYMRNHCPLMLWYKLLGTGPLCVQFIGIGSKYLHTSACTYWVLKMMLWHGWLTTTRHLGSSAARQLGSLLAAW